ncbi:MAG: hypothetical protein FJY86_04245 [Candidatus Diapherotrites archaeon]|uniref:Uncharacterized protein n=1 Tax=Candidatus Iainarchaeum sp. TaxID=3101447 RepID=A0A8T4C7S6_9ARCH|nr:hypothetical protein [Candidatus Diapherotrites archaeon]
MPILKKLNSRRIQRLWRHLVIKRRLSKQADERLGEGVDAHPNNILKYGRKFLKEFKTERFSQGDIRIQVVESAHESPVSIIITHRQEKKHYPIGRIKIGFTNDGIVIEAIQGIAHHASVSDVNQILGQAWANQIIQIIEKNARKQGMKKIYLKDPETMYWYHAPLTGFELGSGAHEEASEEVRKTMKNFYGIIAKRNGFRRTTSGIFVKEL